MKWWTYWFDGIQGLLRHAGHRARRHRRRGPQGLPQARRGSTGDGGSFQPPPGWDEGFEFHNNAGQGPADHAQFSEFFCSVFGKSAQRGKASGNYRARVKDHHAANQTLSTAH